MRWPQKTKTTTRPQTRKQTREIQRDGQSEVRTSKCERRSTKHEVSVLKFEMAQAAAPQCECEVLRVDLLTFLLYSIRRTSTFDCRTSFLKRRAKFEEDACAFLAEANVNAQEDRLNAIEPKAKSDIAFQVFQVDVTSSRSNLPGIAKDCHVHARECLP